MSNSDLLCPFYGRQYWVVPCLIECQSLQVHVLAASCDAMALARPVPSESGCRFEPLQQITLLKSMESYNTLFLEKLRLYNTP